MKRGIVFLIFIMIILVSLNLIVAGKVIFLFHAQHLDENMNFISDISSKIKYLDNIWSEVIENNHYVRITFKEKLDSTRDITLYPKVISGNPKIEVYKAGGTEKIAEFDHINSNEYNTIYLTNLKGRQDTFDLRVVGGSIELNYITDPSSEWNRDTEIVASLVVPGSFRMTPSVFYKDSSWYLISGASNGKFYGYAWNGTNWLTNLTINASLPSIVGYSAPSVFYKDSSWYLISGASDGKFYGYAWNGTNWLTNLTINASLLDIGSNSAPSVFYKNSSWYIIAGGLNSYGSLYGFSWNGTQWLKDMVINASLPTFSSFLAPSVFYKNSSWYILLGENSKNFYGFKWVFPDITPPTYDQSTVGVNNTLAGELTNFYVNASDETEKDGFYLEDNNTGVWHNETFKKFYEVGEMNYTYYFRGVSPIHGQDIGTGYDSGALLDSAPIINETRYCTSWVQYWFDGEEDLTKWHISKIYWHVYYNSSGTPYIGYGLEGTYNFYYSGYLYRQDPISSSSSYSLYQSVWDVDISPTEIYNKSFFIVKLTGTNPQIISGPGMQSYIVLVGGVSDSWANYSITLNDTAGLTVGYRWYFNDTTGNTNSTPIYTLATTDTVPPKYLSNSVNSTAANKPATFSINVTDNATLLHPNGQYTFSTDNSGSWVNDSAVNFTSTPSWANVTKVLNSTVGALIGYMWYFNDTAGNTNSTPIYTLTTTDGFPPHFTIIPANFSLFYGNQSLGVYFNATDETKFGYYSINDTRFSINQTGFLSNATSMAYGNYEINVTINDTSNNINWTRYTVQVNKSVDYCGIYFDDTSPITFQNIFKVYTNCTSAYVLYRNGTAITNNSVQSLTVGAYNFSILRNDTSNYSYIYNETQMRIIDAISSSSVGGYLAFISNEGELDKGYSMFMHKNWKVSFNVGGILHMFKVEDVNKTSVKVSISSETQEATLSIGQEKKFEISGDNYYDFLVKLNSINTGFTYLPKANITIQIIHEEIPSENKGWVTGNAVSNNTNNENVVKTNNKIIYYALGGIVVIGAVVFSFKKFKRKKKYRKFRY